ncbi:hypothetical protein RhiirA1_453360 [Rhizophagus irregularis]|uniref:Uncharacterized protein n=1 Tax=Rhizophagus irregularis TaxID=588596 RepID=A0A2I1EWG3_9GLOM|nr:hypothetical protein RhiirA1_453360 [Rhizophagus irregularis]PKY26466.1 hypothetical protein RhiirB3_441790 [Rhizophagus irregularis]
MACSKIFLGDLPELINEIIQYFHHDYKTLHSCILINRLWCRLAIPLLWEDPFSIKFPKNYHFIEIYLHNLNDDDKTKLNKYEFNNDLIPSNTLFNYPSFIQHLNTRKIINSINNWKSAVGISTTKARNFKKFIHNLLYLIFIENIVNLHSLEVVLSTSQEEYFNNTLNLILQNPNLFRNIKNLKLEDLGAETLIKLSTLISSNCNSISSLYFDLNSYNYTKNNNQMIEKYLSQIINSQENLRRILFDFYEFTLSLLSLKNSNCSNTLNTIVFCYVDFKNIIGLIEIFNQLNVLESIHIIFCKSLDTKFISQIINITKPFKLKSLIFNEILQIESLILLIQKFGNNIEDFGFSGIKESQQLPQLLESVIIYCCKIKFLYLPGELNSQNINLLFNLIENIKQNLNYLLIDTYDSHLSSIILQNLGQILPFKLEYLKLSLVINTSDFETFLKNSQNIFIKKLVITNNRIKDEIEDIFPYIKEYIIKKKRVKYLAIREISTCIMDCDSLFSLKDKVDILKLYDIQVLDYHSLYISNVGKFIYDNKYFY